MNSSSNNNKLFDLASKRLGVSHDRLKDVASKDSGKLLNSLSESDREKVTNVLNDPEKTREILSSPKAQELLKKFLGEK